MGFWVSVAIVIAIVAGSAMLGYIISHVNWWER